MRYLFLIWLFCLSQVPVSCGQNNEGVSAFKKTEALELAQAVNHENLRRIEKLVNRDPNLLNVTSADGTNVLVLSIYLEKFNSFRKLLELGANPNFITDDDKYSVLIHACAMFDKGPQPFYDNRYAKLLLEYGADPNYAMMKDFTNEQGIYKRATSPLLRAAGLNLELVKLLINYGADPYKPVGEHLKPPFAAALEFRKFDIIYYFIEELKVDVHQPMYLREEVSNKGNLYVQDYIKRFMNYKSGTEGDKKKQELIKYLEAKGVDFKNYDYKV